MFSQTFVDGTQQTKKPVTVLASTLLQIGVTGVGVLVPLLYTQRLPTAALKTMLTAPPPPTPKPKTPTVRVAQKTTVIARSLPSSVLVAPTVIPKQVAPSSDARAPDLSGLNGTANDGSNAGNSLLYGSTGAMPEPPPPMVVAKTKPSGPVRVGGVVAEANVIHRVQPLYPALAKSARVQGTVEFTAVISKQGRVERLMLVRGHPLLVSAARDAILQWQYRPTLLNGQPVEVLTTITVNFTLSQ